MSTSEVSARFPKHLVPQKWGSEDGVPKKIKLNKHLTQGFISTLALKRNENMFTQKLPPNSSELQSGANGHVH